MSARGKKMAGMDATLLRREIAARAGRGQLARLPIFKTEERLPSQLNKLILRLDKAEQRKR